MNMAGHGPRADRGCGDRRTDRKALRRQGIAQQPEQIGLAAEQMGAAGDVQEQPVWGIERYQRREAVAPVGDVLQCPGVRRHIGIEHLQMRADGAGIGERLADRKAIARGRVIQRIDDKRIVLLGDDDSRSVNRRAAAVCEFALDAVDGQPWQPQAEDPPLCR
jgi:hypothetical protein